MPRIPSKGPPLYACLCASVALAAVAFWLNPPTDPVAPPSPAPSAQPAASATSPNDQASDDDLSDRVSAVLRATAEGDAATMRALEALANDPALTVATGPRLLREFPDRASEIGTILIGALVRNSQHSVALELAQAGPEASRAEWLQLILSHWANAEPDAGRLIVDQLRQNAVSSATFELVTKNWASSAPADLARYALALPTGEYRSIAFSAALEPWLLRDPAAFAACLPQLTELNERDSALAALATRTDTDFRPTAQAVRWAEAIDNAELRRATLARVIRDWFDREPAAASEYLLQQPEFSVDLRDSLLASFAPRPEAL